MKLLHRRTRAVRPGMGFVFWVAWKIQFRPQFKDISLWSMQNKREQFIRPPEARLFLRKADTRTSWHEVRAKSRRRQVWCRSSEQRQASDRALIDRLAVGRVENKQKLFIDCFIKFIREPRLSRAAFPWTWIDSCLTKVLVENDSLEVTCKHSSLPNSTRRLSHLRIIEIEEAYESSDVIDSLTSFPVQSPKAKRALCQNW